MPLPVLGYVTREIRESYDLLPLHAGNPLRYPYLLESVVQSVGRSRYDILFAFPNDRITLDAHYRVSLNGQPKADSTFLVELDRAWQAERAESIPQPERYPFYGGWFVYLGYELCAEIEPKLGQHSSDGGLPIAMAVRCPAAIIRDHARQTTVFIAEKSQSELLDRMQTDYVEAMRNHATNVACAQQYHHKVDTQEDPSEEYLERITRVKNYIMAGDVFQVNLSRQWHITDAGALSEVALYDALKRHNPAPFSGLMVDQDWSVICSSPERLVSVVDGVVETRPIAGTRPRAGANREHDLHLSKELLAHAKERSEHVMLIDLERNDLGRVCELGSVEVDELMALESFAHVHHIVSNVRGTLKPNTTPGDVIRAVFPGGTITGCPKVRCMEIIRELECAPRGPYTGSMGYINHDGSLDFNILIRTIVKQADQLTFRTGAGIVADSVPEKELQETRDKARGLLLALEDTSV